MPRPSDSPRVAWPNITEAVYTWLKIIGALTALVGIVVAITQHIDAQDKRIDALQTATAQQSAELHVHVGRIDANDQRISAIERWIPTADFKLNLLLKHFGIPVPDPQE